ncbi:MAG: EpsI family protein [Candidatus Omnitrophica bacterium]|nr:EpsI family protein [Candidatus Omnitrophota bacterium]
MKNKTYDKNHILIIALMLISAAISWHLYFKVYSQKDTVSIHAFPQTIAGWSAEEIMISQQDKAILETDNVFVRRYTNPRGEAAYLFIVYSQNNRKVSHPPEVCYTGSGATILSNVHDSFSADSSALKDIKVNRVTVEQGRERQIFFYWFKVGDTFTPNYWKQQGLIALKSFLGQPSSSALIRISISAKKEEDDANATQKLKDFGRMILPYLQKYLP